MRKHPKWDAAEHVDPDDDTGFTELFVDDLRPRPSGKPGKAKKRKNNKSETTQGTVGVMLGQFKAQSLLV